MIATDSVAVHSIQVPMDGSTYYRRIASADLLILAPKTYDGQGNAAGLSHKHGLWSGFAQTPVATTYPALQ